MGKQIKQLAALVDGAKIIGRHDIEITGIEHDSRQVKPGDLFVCISGTRVDGHDFIEQAQSKGAIAILTDRRIEQPLGMSVLYVPVLRRALALMVPFFYDYPAGKMRLIGITGTNGKTTTSYLLRDVLRRAGYKVGLIGTIQIMIEDQAMPIHNTTPDIIDLQHTLALMRDAGMDYVIMEVSSHALAQGRVDGCVFVTAIFTNLTQDHLDYHKTMANYMLAKAKLFDALPKAQGTAVVNIDDTAGETMLSHARCRHLTYGIRNEADLRAEKIDVRALGAGLSLVWADAVLPVQLKVTGVFNIYNVLAAVGAALAEKIKSQIILEALQAFAGAPGRFELVSEGQPFAVIVDYAHTPDGLENILRTARQITQGKLITVFGCGGDRDRTKRPIMGRIAAELSDVILATSDNPRSEDPEAILQEVENGVREKLTSAKLHEKITDRRQAIARAIDLAKAGDTVVIAGKGHEDYQILRSGTIHFDDKEEVRKALRGKV